MRTANVRTIVIRTLVALVGAAGWSVLARARGEDVSAAWMVAAALGSYAIGYRFYSKVIAYKVLKVDATRAHSGRTPQRRHRLPPHRPPCPARPSRRRHRGRRTARLDHPQAPVPTRRAFERMGTERQEGDPRKGFRCC